MIYYFASGHTNEGAIFWSRFLYKSFNAGNECVGGIFTMARRKMTSMPVIFQIVSLLAALTHPGHIVIYAPRDSFP
ncbi:hypothetical protein CE143_08700 [Photorhabdus luminescens]|uniref:Uncharacterized protein n=1 Tax=Photorhabdus akhurstii TaxID=171438 RepID=A0ABX8LYN1_9GAMM|nr:hypothetical protein B0X70_08785 [Photorhabdus akhurstii]UJD75015.1 hypothetical protein CE143_08700 [Photorhabdus luminescens]